MRSTGGISPGKQIGLRTELINQLDRWHQLLEKGAITQDQYQELQEKILSDVKKF